eukprot:363083-Chlamydomonas_euryale.AAC.13
MPRPDSEAPPLWPPPPPCRVRPLGSPATQKCAPRSASRTSSPSPKWRCTCVAPPPPPPSPPAWKMQPSMSAGSKSG